MRLLSFQVPTLDGPQARLGALAQTGGAVDLTAAYYAMLLDRGGIEPAAARRLAGALIPTDMVAFLEGGEWSMEAAREALTWATRCGGAAIDGTRVFHERAGLHWLAPVPRPPRLRDCLASEEHLRKSLQVAGVDDIPGAWFEIPLYYKGNPLTVVGHEAEISWPTYSSLLDYELEIACVIGRGGQDIPAEKAHQYIAGYTIFNDFSARDVQGREMTGLLGPAKGKDFAGGNTLGPVLVTPDELPDPYNLRMVARINGEVSTRGHSSSLRWRFAEIIAYMSRDEPIVPGEVIGSGTVAGGSGLEHGRFISPGDVVELEVESIGVLRNRIMRGQGGTDR